MFHIKAGIFILPRDVTRHKNVAQFAG